MLSLWSQSRRWLLGVALLATGVCIGALIQKYYGVGHLVQGIVQPIAIEPTPRPVPSPTPARIEVPMSDLPRQRMMVALAFGQSNSANFGGTPRIAGQGVY